MMALDDARPLEVGVVGPAGLAGALTSTNPRPLTKSNTGGLLPTLPSSSLTMSIKKRARSLFIAAFPTAVDGGVCVVKELPLSPQQRVVCPVWFLQEKNSLIG